MFAAMRNFRSEDGYARWVRATDPTLLVVSVLFLGLLALPLLGRLTPTEHDVANVAYAVSWAVFVLDYLSRLYLAPRRWKHFYSHPLDLAIVALPVLRPIRAARALRLVRFIRIAKIGSITALIHDRMTRTLHARVVTYVLSLSVIAIFVASLAVREAERESPTANIRTLGSALWWAITTVTTVGYGDSYPTTTLGKVIAVALMAVGIALIGVVTASVAAWFVNRLQDVQSGVDDAESKLDARFELLHAELQEIRALLTAARQPPAEAVEHLIMPEHSTTSP